MNDNPVASAIAQAREELAALRPEDLTQEEREHLQAHILAEIKAQTERSRQQLVEAKEQAEKLERIRRKLEGK